jgi:hypothetical protein
MTSTEERKERLDKRSPPIEEKNIAESEEQSFAESGIEEKTSEEIVMANQEQKPNAQQRARMENEALKIADKNIPILSAKANFSKWKAGVQDME